MKELSKKVGEIRGYLTSFELEYAKFENGNKAAGTRARKDLMEVKRLAGEIRLGISEVKAAA